MKICPVCHARCFDDMTTCFGCLHRFGDGDYAPIDELDVAEPNVPDSIGAGGADREADREPVNIEKAVEGDDGEQVVATVRPSRGMHGALVVRIEIPTSLIRTSAVDVSLEPARK